MIKANKIQAFFIYVYILSSILFVNPLLAQEQKLLALNDFLNLVKKNHPLAQQADIISKTAKAELLKAKGGFDPKFFGDHEQKYFDNKNYFSLSEYGIKIPTWYGVELKGGYNRETGSFINPQNILPPNGQAILGVSVPLLQNLWIDDRRADLFKARELQDYFRADREILTNDLIFESSQAYWKWAFYYRQMIIFQDALKVATERFNAIKTSFELGDRMAMDTLESYTQVQDRQIEYNRVLLEWQEASLKLGNYLWVDKKKPMPLFDGLYPQALNTITLNTLADKFDALENVLTHPVLKMYDSKIKILEIDKKLKKEKLKPLLNANYNFLGNGINYPQPFVNNYKWGITLSTSMLFRKERGDVKLAKLKIETTQLEKNQKEIEIQNKLRQYFIEVQNLERQINLSKSATDNFKLLLSLENTRFLLGESSFFLINSRENKYLESQIKLAKLIVEFQIANTAAQWAWGKLAF